MLDNIIEFDENLFLLLNSLGNQSFDWFWIFMTGKLEQIPFYVLLLILLYSKLGLKPTLYVMLVVAALIASSDQLSQLFKYGFERCRPCGKCAFGESKIRFLMDYCGRYGYFSAHASSSMSLAIFLGLILKKYYKYALIILIAWSLIVGYSRIYVGVHYPLDVLTGWFFGIILALIFYKLKLMFFKKLGI